MVLRHRRLGLLARHQVEGRRYLRGFGPAGARLVVDVTYEPNDVVERVLGEAVVVGAVRVALREVRFCEGR